MQDPGCYEKYPTRVIFVSNLLSLLIYSIGAYVLFRFGLIWVILYIIFILVCEFRLLSGHCVDCYYYGKRYAFGKGWLNSRLFLKGNPQTILQKNDHMERYYPGFFTVFHPGPRRDCTSGHEIQLDNPHSCHCPPCAWFVRQCIRAGTTGVQIL